MFSLTKARALHLQLGRRGEAIAARVLQECGMELLMRNYRGPRGEIDLIFRQNNTLCFVEVKTRHRQPFGSPADAVNREKRRSICRTAARYCREIHAKNISCRFDIVEIIFEKKHLREIRHWPNAFSPEERNHPSGHRPAC